MGNPNAILFPCLLVLFFCTLVAFVGDVLNARWFHMLLVSLLIYEFTCMLILSCYSLL